MSDSDDDYMSDKFLQNDSKPGLMPKIYLEKHQRKEKAKQNKEPHQKLQPVKAKEVEQRNEKLKEALDESNKGFAMLSKMGFKKGMGLGKQGQGRAEPIPLEIKSGRKGLGKEHEESERKKKIMEAHVIKMKRRKLEEENLKGDFKSRMRGNFLERQITSDLYKSQKACHHLDLLKNLEPQHSWSWPRMHENEAEEEIDESGEPQVSEKLEILTYYLRTTHLYCIWCGATFNDAKDLKDNCPGDSFDAHE